MEEVVKQSGTGFGFDVAKTRADDLDKKLLAEVSGQVGKTVLDLGSGAGGMSVRLAEKGASVTAVDVFDFSADFSGLRQAHQLTEQQLHFVPADLSDLANLLASQQFDYCLLQRVIHYLPYEKAQLFLSELRSHIKDKLYISVSGLETDIGDHYECGGERLEKRFCALTEEAKKTFFIQEPLCLYTPEEFINLLQVSGWVIEECWVSAFGNIKAICSHQ